MYVCMYVANAYRIVLYRIVMVTRMLAINVPIPNLTVARLEQFRTPTDVGVNSKLTILYTKFPCRYLLSEAIYR